MALSALPLWRRASREVWVSDDSYGTEAVEKWLQKKGYPLAYIPGIGGVSEAISAIKVEGSRDQARVFASRMPTRLPSVEARHRVVFVPRDAQTTRI